MMNLYLHRTTRAKALHWLVLSALVVPAQRSAAQQSPPGGGGEVAPAAAPPTEKVEGSDAPVDISQAQWQEEYRRLSDLILRVDQDAREFEVDVNQAIEQKFREERARHERTYDALLEKLEDEVKIRRKEAIARYEHFLQRYPNSDQTALAMVRLAELYYEEAEEDFILANEEYDRQNDDYLKGKRSAPPDEPLADYSRSLALYERLLRDFPAYPRSDVVLYMRGYMLERQASVNYNPDAARDAYIALLERYPDSDLAFQAYLRIGNYYFDNNQIEESITYFRKAMEYRDKPWDRALYKLAWAYYRMGNMDEAIANFVDLLDYSDRLKAEKGVESDVRPEGVEYLAISLADAGNFDAAVARFNALGEKPYKKEVLTRLAEVYYQQAKFTEAIDAYTKLQGLFPENPDNPDFQAKVASIYLSLPGSPDVNSAIAAQRQLVDSYNPDSQWADTMSDNMDKKALTHSAGLVQESLESLAYHYHSLANSPDTSPADREQYYKLASQNYEEYLKRFPFSPKAFELQYYYADCLFYSSRIEESTLEYKKALTYTNTQFHAQAAQGLVEAYKVLIERSGSADGVVQPMPVEGVAAGQMPDGAAKAVPLATLLQNYVDAIDTYTRIDPKAQDAAGNMFLAARIFYFHFQYEEARRRFTELIDLYPQDANAPFAAVRIADSYFREGNWDKVRESVDAYTALSLGKSPAEWEKSKATLRDLKSKSVFKDALVMMGTESQATTEETPENYMAAGKKFEGYATEFPDTELADQALYNAAIAYERAGATDRAIDVYKRLIRDYPKSEYVEPGYRMIASNYERRLNLTKAIEYHEALAQNFPESTSAATSLYNASYLRLGLKQYKEAARGFEKYVRTYPNQGDAAGVLFLAAQTYEKAEDYQQAIRVYREYLSKYSSLNGDLVMEANVQIIEDLNKLGRGREALEVEKSLPKTFEALKQAQLISRYGLNLYAQVVFREVERLYATYDSIKFQGSTQAMVKQLEKKQAALQSLQDQVVEVAKLGGEYRWASFYTLGLAQEGFAAAIEAAPVPGGLSEEEQEVYLETLREQFVYPNEEKAAAIYKQIIQEARQAQAGNVWIDRTYDRLHKLEPQNYPIRKTEGVQPVPASRGFGAPPIDVSKAAGGVSANSVESGGTL